MSMEEEFQSQEQQYTAPVSNPEEHFPPKPVIPESPFLGKALISLVLFIGVYYFFFRDDVVLIGLLVLVLFIHELGHFLAMKMFGYSEVKMFFVPFFGALVTGEKHEVSQRQRAIILLAGPVPGLIIGTILYFVGEPTHHKVILQCASLFVFLNAINLLPLNPLDGGKLIETLFFQNRRLLSQIFMIASGAIIAGIAIKFDMFSLLIIPFFMITRLASGNSAEGAKERLTARGVDFNKPYEALTDREYWLIRAEIINNIPGFRNENPNHYQPHPREAQIVRQVKALADRRVVNDLGIGGVLLFLFIWMVFLVVPAITAVIFYLARH